MTRRIGGLSEIIAQFDAIVTDQYGVLHDGQRAFPGAQAALGEVARRGLPVATLTNSGKRSASNAARLERLGFPRALVGHVISSGELARDRLAALPPGSAVLLVTRDGESELIDGLDLVHLQSGDGHRPDLIVLAGIRPEKTRRRDYAEALAGFAAEGVSMLLVNPDTLMGEGGATYFGPGAVAEDYRMAGGSVTVLGKPAPAMFEAALTALGAGDPGRVLMIGDSPEHDIAGARALGLRSLLIEGGVQAGLSGGVADCVASSLRWE